MKLELWCENKLQVSRFQFEKDKVFLGEVGDEPWKNYIIMLGKRYIYQCRCSKIELSEIGFEKYLVQYMNIEYTIARNGRIWTNLTNRAETSNYCDIVSFMCVIISVQL